MGKNSGISWTDHTFNPWWGCEKVSPACDHCYAETLANRWGHEVWGKGSKRRFFTDKHWREPFKWDAAAKAAGRSARVFCASMADVFEDRGDLDSSRQRLWDLIGQTPNLTWMLLTKRPENILGMVPGRWTSIPPRNVWLGTTAENQRRADERIHKLLRAPAVVHWLSAEPLLGPLRVLDHMMQGTDPGSCGNCHHGHGFIRCPNYGGIANKCWQCGCTDFKRVQYGLGWIIVGGESGHGARRMDPQWARDLLAQCRRAYVPYHFKQKGEILSRELGCKDKAGKDPAEWPAEFRVQEFPEVA